MTMTFRFYLNPFFLLTFDYIRMFSPLKVQLFQRTCSRTRTVQYFKQTLR